MSLPGQSVIGKKTQKNLPPTANSTTGLPWQVPSLLKEGAPKIGYAAYLIINTVAHSTNIFGSFVGNTRTNNESRYEKANSIKSYSKSFQASIC